MKNKEKHIRRHLGELYADLPIFIYKSTDSTNQRAKDMAKESGLRRAVFLADGQSAGRGRMGRSFSSIGGKGLYLSILTEGGMPAERAIDITTYMATVASDVIEELSGADVKIKWVNDLYINGKKAGGILTEGETAEDGTLAYSVCGIGINLRKQRFPDGLEAIATTVEDETGRCLDVNAAAGMIISRFLENLHTAGTAEAAASYRNRSFLIGSTVRVVRLGEEYDALVTGITDRCMLELRLGDGSTEILSTGEVVRLSRITRQ